jgi:predicted protein tyrosine phosphatase
MLPFRLTICGLAELPDHAPAGVSHVVSVLDPGTPEPDEFEGWPLRARHDFRFHDDIVVREDRRPPHSDDISQVLEMGTTLSNDEVSHLLVHCWAGMSRSTSIAMTLMAQAAPGREAEIAEALLSVRQPAWPNSLIIEMADAQLGADGRLIAAKEEVFRRVIRDHPHVVELMENFGRGHEIPSLA